MLSPFVCWSVAVAEIHRSGAGGARSGSGQLGGAADAVTAEAKLGCTPSWESMTLRPT